MTRKTIAALTLLAGAACASADEYTWTSNCLSEDWWAICGPFPDCIFTNNWGRDTHCDLGNPPFPGPTDDAMIIGAPVRLDRDFVHVNSLRAEGPFTFAGGALQVETTAEFFGPLFVENANFAGGDFTVWGPIEFPPHGQFIASGPTTILHVRGPIQWHGGGTVMYIDSGAHVIVEEGGGVEMHGESHIRTVIAGASFTNHGNMNRHAFEGMTDIGVTFTNTGMIDVHAGTLNFTAGGNVFGGHIHLHPPTSILLNGASSVADGLMMMGDGTCTVAHTLDVPAGVNGSIWRMQLMGDLNVAGNLVVENFTQVTGATRLQGGVLGSFSPQPFNFESGTLTGNGSLNATVNVMGGTVAPGQSVGLIEIGPEPRDYTQSDAATLVMELGGTAPDQFDRLTVSGTATLGGTLMIMLIDGFEPGPGDSFTILTAAARQGEFSTTFLPNGMEVEYGPDYVRLVVAGCAADLTTSSDPNDPSYGVPDGMVDAADFFYYLDLFASGNVAAADLTSSSDPNDPSYGVPDGMIDAADFFYFLDLFAAGCQ